MQTKQYASLIRRAPAQLFEEIFAHFFFDSSIGETWETPYQVLANLAKDENWNFTRPEFEAKYKKQQFPILVHYLNYTFLRAQQLGLISYSADDDKACFNTGLQTKNDQDIFALFQRYKGAAERSFPDWTLYAFVDSYSKNLRHFGSNLPDIPTYITDPSDLVFDTNFRIEPNYEHIIEENKDRLPSALQDSRQMAIAAIKGSIELLKAKIIRNYKIAIPNWYKNKIQLLLPLYLNDGKGPDVALVVDKDKESNMYRITTILTMDLAYIDARLLTRPDREWLNP